MKLESKEKSMLFSSTEIPDVFFTEYMPEASGDFVKVYFYMVFLSNYEKDVNINELSKTLALPYPTIQDAIKYWEEQGLIIKTTTGYTLSNIQELELSKLYNPKITSSPEDVINNEKSQYRAHAIECINNQYFQGVMSPTWYTDIDMLFNKYGFDEQVMIALFNYASEKRALHLKYIQTVAEGWYKCNIKTYDDLDTYFENREKLNVYKKEISNKLRLNRQLTTFEEDYVEKWTQEYNYGMDIIDLALQRSTTKSNAGFSYYDKLLTDWHNSDYKTVSDIQNHLNSFNEKKIKTKQIEKSTQTTFEYTQSTFDNFDSFYEN